MQNGRFSPKGIYCAMVTPYRSDGGIDARAIEQQIDFMADRGVDGVFPVSNVGEFALLTSQDRREVIRAVMGRAKGRMRVIPGVSDLRVEDCLDLAEFCASVGCDGVVLCAPYYYPYSQDYIKAFIACVIQESPLPLIIYNSPVFTNPIDHKNLLDMCGSENVVAVKESSGDIKYTLRLISDLERDGLDVSVMMGWEELFYAGLGIGAKGCIVCSAGIVPELLVRLYRAFAAGRSAQACRAQKAIARITGVLGLHGFPHGYKLGILARGFDFRLYRSGVFADVEAQLRDCLPEIAGVIEAVLEEFEPINPIHSQVR